MKVAIFDGGLEIRLMEKTRPKLMVEIGGKLILWQIMNIYEHYGFNHFIIFLGYKTQIVKEYFLNYFFYNSNMPIGHRNNFSSSDLVN